MKAVVADPATPGILAIERVPEVAANDSEAFVGVRAFSLNAGEVRGSLTAKARLRPGWDVAGVVERAAGDGSGPPAGSPVVGFAGLAGGGWAEKVAVATADLAVIPENVSFQQAACLPVAGLTALHSLELAGPLLGRSVLVTGATGGVGQLAVQIAAAGGAEVTAGVRRAGGAGPLLRTGVDRVLVGAARPPAPFDVILDTVGGDSLARSLVNLAPGGTCVVCGNSSDEPTTFMARDFYRVGNVRLHGFFLEPALRGRGARPGLEMLLAMVRRGELTIPITARASWKEIQRVAVQLSDRSIDGKAVLSVGSDPA